MEQTKQTHMLTIHVVLANFLCFCQQSCTHIQVHFRREIQARDVGLPMALCVCPNKCHLDQ